MAKSVKEDQRERESVREIGKIFMFLFLLRTSFCCFDTVKYFLHSLYLSFPSSLFFLSFFFVLLCSDLIAEEKEGVNTEKKRLDRHPPTASFSSSCIFFYVLCCAAWWDSIREGRERISTLSLRKGGEEYIFKRWVSKSTDRAFFPLFSLWLSFFLCFFLRVFLSFCLCLSA